ncbi:MAG: xanthine dehydrogenase family protein molybdopterin-binding subunit [Cytophagales bacterium]|nr:xanthine dehydrogenase family protein molybdopterin-binding subunit [Rhizobacter sp.]
MTTTTSSKRGIGVNRRGFLQTSAVASGGLMIGVSLTGVSDVLAAGTVHTPNAWVHIGDDNTITLLSARSEMGQGVYTSMPMLIAEELNVDIKQIKVAIAPPNGKVYGNAPLGGPQLTGGSTSVRDGWDKLRVAGAQVRMMLVSAAALKWNIPEDQLRAENGMVLGPKGKKATYGQLAAEASRLPVPQTPVLKDPKDFRIVGKPTKRLDTPAKVNGTAEFGIDVKLPGMVYAALEQCPVIGGKVKSFDAAKAKGMPGVIDVVQIPDGVAVVADTWWHANKAREVLSVQWDEGAGATLNDKAMLAAIKAAAVSEAAKPLALPKVGDADGIIKTATKVIKAEYTMPLLSHAPLEPMNFTAHYHDNRIDLIGPTQWQDAAAGTVAKVCGVPVENVSLRTTFLGGGFGRRIDIDYIIQAAQISKAVGKPVKLVWTREDDMTHDFYRPQSVHHLAAAIGADGKPTAMTFRLTSQSVTGRVFGLPAPVQDPLMTEAAMAAYEIPATRHDILKNDAGMRVGYWRSVSHALNAFANETFIDELAVAAGKDPYAYRMSLLANKPRFTNVLKLAAEKAGWGTPAPAGRFRGIALMEGYDTYMAMVAEISVANGEIRVHKVTTAADLGRMVNPDTVEAQIQSSIIFGGTAALWGEITLDKGRVQQTNFHQYRLMRMNESPEIVTVLVPSTEKPGGIGEPATALIGPAIGNALFAATAKRLRKMPFTAENIASA